MQRQVALIVAVGALSCGCSPMGPSAVAYRDVAGRYSGTVVLTFAELGLGTSCSGSTVVRQAGPIVTIEPIELGSHCGGGSIPVGSAAIDEAGNLLGKTNATFSEPGCGTYKVSATGGFSGSELRLSLIARSGDCWSLELEATLPRQPS